MRTVATLFVALLACIAFAPNTVKAQNCATCETIILLIEQWVEQNQTETQIIQYLDTICAAFPQYQATCDQIAQAGVTQIIQYIEQNETPEEVCTQLGQCSSKDAKIRQTAECDTCEEAIGYIDNWLSNSNDQQEVITAVEVICTYFPEWSATCDAIVQAGVPQVINWILTNENATVVCTQLTLCGTAKVQPPAPKPAVTMPAQDSCTPCTIIVGYVEAWLNENATEAQIIGYLEIVCAALPSQYQQTCDTIVATEVPAIIQYLENGQTPEQICTAIGLCSSIKPQPILKLAPKVGPVPLIKIN